MGGRRAPAVMLTLLALVLPGAAALAPSAPLYEYHTYPTLQADLERLAAAHPDLARLSSIGQSHGGLELWTLEVGNLSDPLLAERPALYVDGGRHGDEALGVEVAWLLAQGLVEGFARDAATRALLEQHRVFITPMANPDGATLGARANGALVDLDRNFPFHWGERGAGAAGSGRYAGASPASEPETQATMRSLRERHVGLYASLHAGAQGVVVPFGHAPGEAAPDAALYTRLLDVAREAGLGPREAEGSGQAIDWAYGDQGIVSLVLQVDAPAPGHPPLLRDAVERSAEPHLKVLRSLLGTTEQWGARLEGRFEDIRGDAAMLAVRNGGLGTAHRIAAVATSARLLGPLPASLAPGEEARVPVELTAPSLVRLAYDRLAVVAEHGSTAAHLDVALEFRTAGFEPRKAPGMELVLLAVGVGMAALVLRRP